jgi:hypothetical protein
MAARSNWGEMPEGVDLSVLGGVADKDASRAVCRGWSVQARLAQKKLRIVTAGLPERRFPELLAKLSDWMHVTGLDLTGCCRPVADGCLELLDEFEELESLELDSGFEPEDALGAGLWLDSLRVVRGDGSPCSATVAASLVPLRWLADLSIEFCERVPIEHLGLLTSLTRLDVSGDRVEAGFGGLTALTELRLCTDDFRAGVFEELGALGALRSLTLAARCDGGDVELDEGGGAGRDFEALRQLTGLTCFEMSGFDTERAGDAVRHMMSLMSLTLSHTGVSAAAVNSLRMPELRCLDLGYLRLPALTPDAAGVFADLSHFGALRYLSLNESDVGDATVATLVSLTDLTSLDLSFTPVTAACLSSLLRMTRLERLLMRDMDPNEVGHPVVRAADLSPLLSLTELDLGNSDADDVTVASLTALTGLTRLDLGRAAVTDACVASLKRMPRLRRLGLSGLPFAAEGTAVAADLRAALPHVELHN